MGDEFNNDEKLMYRKLFLLDTTRRCELSLNKKCIKHFDDLLDLARKHRPYELQMQTSTLHQKSWAIFIDGDAEKAVTCLNKMIDLFKANNMNVHDNHTDTLNFFKKHAHMKPASATQEWKEKQLKIYRFRFTVADDGETSLEEAIRKYGDN